MTLMLTRKRGGGRMRHFTSSFPQARNAFHRKNLKSSPDTAIDNRNDRELSVSSLPFIIGAGLWIQSCR